jgi:hypothetical protein
VRTIITCEPDDDEPDDGRMDAAELDDQRYHARVDDDLTEGRS